MRHIGFASSIITEFWALKDVLLLASKLSISQLLVELDAQTMVNLLHSSRPYNNSFSSLLNDCRFLFRQFQQVRISHVFREANRCVDYLAKGGCTFDGDFVVLDTPVSEELCIILDSDASGMYFLRILANTLPFMAS